MVALVQQPSEQELAVHMQLPLSHSRPGPHFVAPPQVHCPEAEQPSALMPQGVQDPPPDPHCVVDAGLTHVPPAQQPPHELGPQLAHVPPLQVIVKQGAQAEPPKPHWGFVLPGSHVLPMQHPLHEELESHVHIPLRQCWPTEHMGPPPQVHAPVALQPSPESLHEKHIEPCEPHWGAEGGASQEEPLQHPPRHEDASHTQCPFRHSCPEPHWEL